MVAAMDTRREELCDALDTIMTGDEGEIGTALSDLLTRRRVASSEMVVLAVMSFAVGFACVQGLLKAKEPTP